MDARVREVLQRLTWSIEKDVGSVRLILFGSRARGDAIESLNEIVDKARQVLKAVRHYLGM